MDKRSFPDSTEICRRLTGTVLVSCSWEALVSLRLSSSAGVTFCSSTMGWAFSSKPSQVTVCVPASSLPNFKVRTTNGFARYGHLYWSYWARWRAIVIVTSDGSARANEMFTSGPARKK